MRIKKKIPVSKTMSQLDELVKKAGIHLQVKEDKTDSPVRLRGKARSVSGEKPTNTSDEEIFAEAMHGVQRVYWKHASHSLSRPAPAPKTGPEFYEHKMMQEAMKGDNPIPVSEHPEYIEGWIGVAGKRFMPNLRNGMYSIQGQIDLHGLTLVEARNAVEEYIIRMSRFRSCCIKIIHGRGINTPVDRATLKDSLPRLLSTRRMSRYVVAYASAPSCDGGVGSIYVLLRRHHH